MHPTPETRASLMIRIRNRADQAAWQDFVEVYWPVIYRVARQKGLQPADAEDLCQTVLLAVSKAVESRPHDPVRARFRTWLDRVTRNAIINVLSRGKPDRASGDSGLLKLLEQSPAANSQDSEWLRAEAEREVFRRAAKQIRREFQPTTWDAFWLTAVDGLSCEAAAERLQKNVGSIYAARSRVMRRLQEKVREYENQ